MVRYIKKKDKNNKNKKEEKEKKGKKEQEADDGTPSEDMVSFDFSPKIEENLDKFKAFLKDSSDAVFREFILGLSGIKGALVYIDGLIDKMVIHDQIMRALMFEIVSLEQEGEIKITSEEALERIKNHALFVADLKEAKNMDEAMLPVMSGEVALMIDGHDQILIVSARGWSARGVSEPQTESLVRGPRDGFTETLRTNTALLRRRCKDPNLSIKTVQVGRRSKTDVAIVYIKGIAREDLIKEVVERVTEIDTDIVFESGQIEQFIEDDFMSPFPQTQPTERPDKVMAALVEGRVAVLVDGSPFAMIVPAVLYQFFQSPEDYYERWIIGSITRSLRWIASLLATFTPALYIALTTFHPGMIPSRLAFSIAAAREGVPFPAVLEAILMEITIELLREAGARLPKAIGQTVGIVGGLVVGDAAVRAGITSPIMVIVVALTAIASFIIPSYNVAISFRIVRFPLMMLAATLGLYGVMLGFIVINIHFVCLKSFGVDYMAPMVPFTLADMKDTLVRLPKKLQQKRPKHINPIDMNRVREKQ